jgi:threonylcarbamoyladenosine tRNA methylthiotransferase MtaB
MKISILTLGCKVNQSESASMEGELKDNGIEVVDFTDRPDACIINTCTVTAKSDIQSRQMIRRAVRSGTKVIATGCYAQLRPDELSDIKGLDLIIGNSEKGKISEHIDRILSQKNSSGDTRAGRPAVCIEHPDTPVHLTYQYSNRSRAFLKIQDGCNFSCSYCTVPMARGKSRSVYPQEIIKAVDKYHRDGFKEIVLTGIHIGSYGIDCDQRSSLLQIVKNITDDYPDIRFRLSSIEPKEFKLDFLTFIKKGAVCPHIHIPLQSGSETILKSMNRGYSVSYYKELIHAIVHECPDISIGTDIIIGFPGEREEHFQETLAILELLPFSYIHVFPYSQRPDTMAEKMEEQVSADVKKKRVDAALKIANKKKIDYMKRYLGRSLDVIVEKKDRTGGLYTGISENYLRTFIWSNDQILGKRIGVQVISLRNGNLFSRP